MFLFLGSYGAFGNQGGSFGANRMDSHRGGSNADRDNRVSDQMHADFQTTTKIPLKVYIKSKNMWPYLHNDASSVEFCSFYVYARD